MRGSAIRGDRTSIEVSLGYNPPDGKAPDGKAGELVAELVKDTDKQVRRAVDDFRQVVERGGLVGGLTVLAGRATPARVGAAVLRKPVTRAVRWRTRFMASGTNTASLELLASQMRRAVAEAAKS